MSRRGPIKNLARHEVLVCLVRDGKYARYGNRPMPKQTSKVIDQLAADGLIVQPNRGVRVWTLTDKGREQITWDLV